MTSLTNTNADSILKNLYGPQKVADSTYKRRPMFAMIPKFEGFGGRNLPLPIKYGNPMGRSAVFATAQTNRSQTRYEDFLLTRVNDFSVATLTGEIAESTRTDKMAFLSALTSHIDAAMDSLADAIETFLPRSGTGSIGQISSGSTVTTDTITLALIQEISNFEVGMTLVASATDGGSVRSGTEVLEAVNRSDGTLRATSAQWDTVITAIAASDFLAVQGDAANGGANVKISGYEAWIPQTAPTSGDSFFGVDRSLDSRLHGQRFDGTSVSVEEALIQGQSIGATEGGAPDMACMHHIQGRTLKLELGSRIRYERMPSKMAAGDYAQISFEAMVVDGDNGPIKVIMANKVPPDVLWLLETETWKLYTLGPAVKFLMLDGLRILRQASDDGYEVRLGFRGNVGSITPGYNTRVALTVPS